MKKHRFTLTVKASTKAHAKTAVLAAFALRNPDGCEFRLTEYRKARSALAACAPQSQQA